MNRKTFGTSALAVIVAAYSHHASAQSINFSPLQPVAGQAITAVFSEPFNCVAPTPALTTSTATTFTFASTLPNGSGIFNCSFIPAPPPTLSTFAVPMGSLPMGNYTVNWNIYQTQTSGPPTLLASTSAALVVTKGLIAAPGGGVDSTPALSIGSLLALGLVIAAAGWQQTRRIRFMMV
jgi:hypothetical protein